MAKKQSKSLVSAAGVEQSILIIRSHKVLLDSDLARLYDVETKTLNQAVRRNIDRFPVDFMFRLTREEWAALRSQFGILDLGRQIGTSNLTDSPQPSEFRSPTVTLKGGQSNRSQIVTGSQKHRDPRYPPFAFTEQGVAMLSSVLRSKQAVQVNIEIMRAFVRLRQVLAVNAELAHRLDEVEKHLGAHDEQFVEVIRAIRQLMEPPSRPRKRIGFHTPADAPTDDKPLAQRGAAKRPSQRRSKQPIRAARGRKVCRRPRSSAFATNTPAPSNRPVFKRPKRCRWNSN